MSTYRKIPVEIQALQYRGDRFELQKWMKLVNVYAPDLIIGNNSELLIPTLEGDTRISKDDYVIIGVKGEFYPCKPDIFELTYELIKA